MLLIFHYLQGRGFNVEIFYVEDPVPDYLQAAVSTVLSIHDQVLKFTENDNIGVADYVLAQPIYQLDICDVCGWFGKFSL